MTVRYFCDICTGEVEDPNAEREFRTSILLRKPPEGHTATRSVGIQIRRSIDGPSEANRTALVAFRLDLALNGARVVMAEVADALADAL